MKKLYLLIITILASGLLLAQKPDKHIARLNKQSEIKKIKFLNDSLVYHSYPYNEIYNLRATNFDMLAIHLLNIQKEYIPRLGRGKGYFFMSDKKEFNDAIKYVEETAPTLNALGDYKKMAAILDEYDRKLFVEDSINATATLREKQVKDSIAQVNRIVKRKELDSLNKIKLERERTSKVVNYDKPNRFNRPWELYGMDSVSFVFNYGTIEQYLYQKSISDKSSHKQLCILIGAQALWLYNFAYYLGLKNYNVKWDEPEDFQGVIITATPKIYTTSKPPVVKVKAPYNNDLQILSVTITGPADDLIDIFLWYWEFSEISVNELKSKGAITQELVSDKISFTWPGINPVIKVEKNKDAAMDFFPFK